MTSSIDHLHKPTREPRGYLGEPIPSQKEWLSWSQDKQQKYDDEIREEIYSGFGSNFDTHVEVWMDVCCFAKSALDEPEYMRKRASSKHPMHNACTLGDTRYYLHTRVPEFLEKYQVGVASDMHTVEKLRKQFNFIHQAVVKLGDSEFPIYIYPTQRDGMTRVSFTRNGWKSHKREDTFTTYYYLVPREVLIPIYKNALEVQNRRAKLLQEK